METLSRISQLGMHTCAVVAREVTHAHTRLLSTAAGKGKSFSKDLKNILIIQHVRFYSLNSVTFSYFWPSELERQVNIH